MKYCAVRDEKGFSLIEVLFALTIFAVGVLAVVKMQDCSIKHNCSAKAMTEALAAGESQLNQLLALDYAVIDDGSASVGRYSVNWDVTEDSPVTNAKDIQVTVSWTESGSTSHSVNLRSIKAN